MRPTARGARPLALQAARGTADLAIGQVQGPHLPRMMESAHQALSQCVGRCAAALSPRDGACDAALDAAAVGGDAEKRLQSPKMDLPLQLGKGTLSPKSNSSRNKENKSTIINTLLFLCNIHVFKLESLQVSLEKFLENS
ncbi:hypothetical protein HAX54_016007 [Datura stramonium]|uniref:Uncharacterized protein n=1 Tax=Datura stramonium TaxID=4076 RepID=A0ABS8S058_DATST|nr:hypothetical protein [Datura stramonium]